VTSSGCEKFFNDAIAALVRNGGLSSDRGCPSTLQGVLGIATFNSYNPNLTARKVGETDAVWADVKNKFDNPQPAGIGFGATLRQNRIFLPDRAFYQGSNIVSQMLWAVDLPGII
jgi:hypothetical protein